MSARPVVLAALLWPLFAAPRQQPAATPAVTAVGTQEGQLSVNGNGAATYMMDLELPPGTNGNNPTLSVWYGSQSTNGLLGNAFMLQGLSSIQRCQASRTLDGYDGG